jgi:uncharacterized protein
MNNKNVLIFATILLVVVVVAYFILRNGAIGAKTADLNGHTVKLEIADEQSEQEKGLSNRDSLAKDTGMLFVFGRPERSYAFWMKDMHFPIDMIFLRDEKIVTIHANVPPYLPGTKIQNLTTYTPANDANRVLELNAGQAREFGLKEGDSIKFNL